MTVKLSSEERLLLKARDIAEAESALLGARQPLKDVISGLLSLLETERHRANQSATAMSQAVIRADEESARVERVRRALNDAQITITHTALDENVISEDAVEAIKWALR